MVTKGVNLALRLTYREHVRSQKWDSLSVDLQGHGWTSTSLALPALVFGLVGPYSYDLLGQAGMRCLRRSCRMELGHALASK